MSFKNITIYHNPRCSKSRQALDFLESKQLDFKIVDYQKDIPSEDEVLSLIQKLKLPLNSIIRIDDKAFKELSIKIDEYNDIEAAKLIANNIKIIQRPIIVIDDNAVIARPIENLIKLF
ncbi:MAG: arsenate reductase [Rickettsiales bacterium]|nr:arsenate reductase [Rickettsiales bacterium]